MPMCLKDIAVILGNADELSDSVVASIALRLARHDSARITILDRRPASKKSLSPNKVLDRALATNIDICGVPKVIASTDRSAVPIVDLMRPSMDKGHKRLSRMKRSTLFAALRCNDIIIIGADNEENGRTTLSGGTLARYSGRPVLLVPYAFVHRYISDQKVGYRVMVAWDGSASCARALHDAIPFLRRASETVLLVVDESEETTASQQMGDMIVGHLAQHNVKAYQEVVGVGASEPSRVILDRCAELGIDLIVMGAFGHSRLIEKWFGGTSETIFHEFPFPIFTSH